MDMNTRPNRREAMRWIFSASLGTLTAEKLNAGTTVLHDEAGKVNFDPIRSRIQQAIISGDATGAAVAVVQGGRVVWEEGFGWANQEAGVKATPHTPFSLASITKPFTATTIMTLVAEGKLALDKPANQYLAGCQLVGTDRNAEAVSVRLLGAHASGLPGIFESYGPEEQRLVPSPRALLQAYGRLAYPPASCYEYSNLGFAALNAIALALTQTELGSLMQRRVLAPLGLNNSFFGTDTARVKSGARRYDAHGRLIPHYTTSTPASGELYASAHDLARFALFNMRQGVEGPSAILSEQTLAELHRPVFTGPSGVATTFGWFRSRTTSSVPFLFKSGGDPGVANRMCFLPTKDLACVVVTNRSNGWELACSVCDEVLTNYLPDWRRPVEDCGFPSKPFVATPAWKGLADLPLLLAPWWRMAWLLLSLAEGSSKAVPSLVWFLMATPAENAGAIPTTLASPGASRFWLAVCLIGVTTGLAAAALTRLLEVVQHIAWHGSGTNILDAARQASVRDTSSFSSPQPF
jgi:CubicO group peptidase (beta-lactamase class C family)